MKFDISTTNRNENGFASGEAELWIDDFFHIVCSFSMRSDLITGFMSCFNGKQQKKTGMLLINASCPDWRGIMFESLREYLTKFADSFI